MKTRVFLRRPLVPGFWPAIGAVRTVAISMGLLLRDAGRSAASSASTTTELAATRMRADAAARASAPGRAVSTCSTQARSSGSSGRHTSCGLAHVEDREERVLAMRARR